MAETSYLWTTGGAGDGASTYTRSDWSIILKVVAACMDNEGIAPAFDNALVPSVGGANTVNVSDGGAIVDGKVYQQTGTQGINIPSATGGGNTRIDRIVLRADWTLQTVRITRIAGTDAASPTAPAITQTTGVTYDIKICQALVDTAGTVTLTDERTFAKPGTDAIVTAAITDLAVTTAKIAAEAVTTAKIADLNVTTAKIAAAAVTTAKIATDAVDDTQVGNRVPALTRRQGGSATDWSTPGTTDYTPTAVRMQTGTVTVNFTAQVASSVTITFPVAFSQIPIVIASVRRTVTELFVISAESATTTQVTFTIETNDGAVTNDDPIVSWLAIGAE